MTRVWWGNADQGHSDQVVIFPIFLPQEIMTFCIVRDKIHIVLAFSSRTMVVMLQLLQLAATLEHSLVQLEIKNMSQKPFFYSVGSNVITRTK